MITKTEVATIAPNSTLWDAGKGAVSGFGARRQKGDAVAYFVKFRTKTGKQRWHTIGRHGAPWTPDMARTEAKRILGEVARGGDPSQEKLTERRAETVADICALYREATQAGRLLTRRGAAKKAATLDGDRGRIDRHILPVLGAMKIKDVTRRDVENFRDAVAEGRTAVSVKTGKRGLARVTGGKGTSTRALGLLGAIFSYAVREGFRPDNPVTGVDRHAYQNRRRRLSSSEYSALLGALDRPPDNLWPNGVEATRFLLFTGWRRGEALKLKWRDLDLDANIARLEETKTGFSARPLSAVARDIINSRPRAGTYVFPAPNGDCPLASFPKIWSRIAASAELPADVTPHVFRHSYASLAADMGYSEPVIAALIGHKGQSVTSRYTHAADAVLVAAANAIAERISSMGKARRHADD